MINVNVSSSSRPRCQCRVLPRLVVAAGSPRHLVVNHPDVVPESSRQSVTVGWYKSTGTSETGMCEVDVTETIPTSLADQIVVDFFFFFLLIVYIKRPLIEGGAIPS